MAFPSSARVDGKPKGRGLGGALAVLNQPTWSLHGLVPWSARQRLAAASERPGSTIACLRLFDPGRSGAGYRMAWKHDGCGFGGKGPL